MGKVRPLKREELKRNFERCIDAIAPSAQVGVKAGNPLIDRFYERKRLVESEEPSVIVPYPITKLEDLFNYYSAIKAEENCYFARVDAGLRSTEALLQLKKRRGEIEKEYAQVLNYQDHYIFPSLDGLGIFLERTLFFSGRDIAQTLKHEERHLEAIRKRGYTPNHFGCWLCVNKKGEPRKVVHITLKLEKLMKKEDYALITRADKNWSCIDDLCKF